MKGLIFIPDISGYTRFITSTETNHSRHIIKELIEVILQSNNTGLIVSEIEGDAVLFYRLEPIPEPDFLVEQAESMFTAFHKQLKIIERDNICSCGACRTSSGLSLKFIIHCGEIEQITILNHSKIMGGDVILAHRLLKNSLPLNEYILFTSAVIDMSGGKFQRKNEFTTHSEQYENFSVINTAYLPLSSLRERIPAPDPVGSSEEKREGGFSMAINAPRNFVYEVLLEDENKLKWVSGLVDVKSDSPLQKIGSKHICVFENMEVSFTNISAKQTEREIVLMQKGNAKGVYFIQQFVLSVKGDSTILTSKMFAVPPEKKQNMVRSILYQIISSVIIFFVDRSGKKDLYKFRDYCESLYRAGNDNIINNSGEL